jgi:hypothetical protein
MTLRPVAALAASLVLSTPLAASAEDLATAFRTLTNATRWEKIGETPLAFEDHHPQGMVKVGDAFYVSSVRIIERTQRYDTPQDGMDRTPGVGEGYLLKFSASGELLDQVRLGEGDAYHPGGIDFDGEAIWVPVAEYRPNSAAIIYRVDPETMEATEVMRFADHIGGVTLDRASGKLHGVSWGSRRFYDWQLDDAGAPVSAEAEPVMNPSFYIDYQDCHYAGPGHMLCGGLNRYGPDSDALVGVGGLDLVDLARNAPVHQLPIRLWVRPDLVMTHNPYFCEAASGAIDCWFAPEDNATVLHHFRAGLPATN